LTGNIKQLLRKPVVKPSLHLPFLCQLLSAITWLHNIHRFISTS